MSGRPAREYHVSIERLRGRVYVCVDGARIYVVAAVGHKPSDLRLRSFPDSFSLGPKAPAGADTAAQADSAVPPRADAGNIGTPTGADGPYKHNEVTKRAVITFKPEPGFPEQAKWFNVTGVVRLRAVLAADGQLKNISVVKPLPHGLTRRSLDAARQIRFEPAQKDGRAVSQYVVLEYNFNIY